jgi:DNA-binding MarR family transcriptional regulator
MSVLNRQPKKSRENPAAAQEARAIRTAVTRLQRRMRAARGDMSIGLSAYSALACIFQHGPISAGELGERERLQPQSLTRILARLEEDKFISRTQDKTDLRRARLLVTPKGIQFLHRNALDQEAWLKRAIAETLSESERAMLLIAAQLIDRIAASPD